MSKVTIKQATLSDISIIEEILLDCVNWLNEMDQPLWKVEDVVWKELSKSYNINDFYVAFIDGNPSGCMAVLNTDPFFWPDIAKGDSFFIHKLAVKKDSRRTGVADTLMDYIKETGKQRGIHAIRLDCHAFRPKLRAFYERHGFVCVDEKVFHDIYNVPAYNTAFYVYRIS